MDRIARRGAVLLAASLALARGPAFADALDEDLAFIEETVAGQLRMTRLARLAIEAERRRRPEGGARLELAETRLLAQEARAEPNPARREELLGQVRERLGRLRGAMPKEGALSTAGPEAAFALARLETDLAESRRSDEAFAAAAKAFEALLVELDRLYEKAGEAQAAGQLDAEAYARLDQKLYVLQAEVRYEYADLHRRWGLTTAQGKRRAEVLEKAIEEFDFAALFTEDERNPDVIYYPKPYLQKAVCERALGDPARARETLSSFLAKRIEHPDAPRVRLFARQQVGDVALAEKDWEGARKAAADLAREGHADAAALLQARAAIEQGLAAQDAAGKKGAEEGFGRLEALAARSGPASAEAAEWLARYREGGPGQAAGGEGALDFLAQADQARAQKNFSEAIRLYRQALAATAAEAWDAQAPRAWLGIGASYLRTEEFLPACAAFLQVAEHPAVDEKTAVEAARVAEGTFAEWAKSVVGPEEGFALLRRHTRALKESVAARFPAHPEVQRYHVDLADAALAEGDPERALRLFEKASAAAGAEPRHRLAAFEGAVEAHRHLLADRLKAAGSRFPLAEETRPLAGALEATTAWLGGPEARPLSSDDRQGGHRRAVSQAAFYLALALPERAIAAVDGFRKAFPQAEVPPEWDQFRCIALARQGKLADARAVWNALRSRESGPASKSLQITANVLGRLASEAVRAARAAENLQAARDGSLWVTELLTFTLGVKENPTEGEVKDLVNRFVWQVTKTQEYMTAIGIGEFLLDRADAWKLPEDQRLQILNGLSDAYWGIEDYPQALQVSKDLEAAYAKKGQFARWAAERVAASARKIAERAKDPVERETAGNTWYEACRRLREATPDGTPEWWGYSREMGRVAVVKGEPGQLRDYLAQLFGIAPDLGGEATRGDFVDLAVWAWRRGDEKQRPFAATLLSDMWARSASWRDPAAAHFIR